MNRRRMTAPTFLSLFSGTGGLDLGLERAGWSCVGQVEIDPFCQRVLARHWPQVPRWDDIKELQADDLPRADLVCAGFPCQPVSVAGKGLAQADERWLWPHVARLVRDLGPRWVLLENVPGLLARGMGDVLGDLAACGYDAEWDCVPASAVGAPHQRDRVWIVAYPQRVELRDEPGRRNGQGRSGQTLARDDGEARALADAEGFGGELRPATEQRPGRPSSRCDGLAHTSGKRWRPGIFARPNLVNDRPQPPHRHARTGRDGGWWATEPDVGRVAYGIPARLDRLRALGNAVVPQVAEHVGRLILQAHLSGGAPVTPPPAVNPEPATLATGGDTEAPPDHQSDPDPALRRMPESGSDPTRPRAIPLFIDGEETLVIYSNTGPRPIRNINPPAKEGVL